MDEEQFRNRLIRDLRSMKINAVNLHAGTFDLLVEGVRPFVCELKRMAKGTRFMGDEEGLKFTEDQTAEILRMSFPPFVLAFSPDGGHYFLTPDWVKEQVEDLSEYATAILMPSAREFPPAMTYTEVLRKVEEFVR